MLQRKASLAQRQNSFQHAGDILLGDHINNEDELNNVNIKIMWFKCADRNMYTTLFFHISYKFQKLDLIWTAQNSEDRLNFLGSNPLTELEKSN